MIIGIDFGTCFSSVSVMNGGHPMSAFFGDSNKAFGIPTVFMYSKEQQKEVYGYDCINSVEAAMNSNDVVKNMKTMIRRNADEMETTVESGGKKFLLKDVIKKYLIYLINEAKASVIKNGEILNTQIEAVTITAPIGIANGQMTATDYNRLLIDTVMDVTGLPREDVHILQEPVAAANAFLYADGLRRQYQEKQTILVFDLGGGTLDVTIVEHIPGGTRYNVKAKEGDLELGGNQWDYELRKFVLKKAGIEKAFSDPKERSDFEAKINKLKHDLTTNDEGSIGFKFENERQGTDVTRKEFEQATKMLLDKAIACTNKALNAFDSERGIGAINKIVLVGGSCNMPQIKERMMAEYPSLGEPNIVLHDPSNAIAKGAALFAKMKKDNPTDSGEIGGDDILSCTYGFKSRRHSTHNYAIYNMLFKDMQYEGESIYKESFASFSAIEDSQEKITFTIYESQAKQGPGDDDEGNWMELGSGEEANGMELTVNVPPEYLGKATKYSLRLGFWLSRDGVLEVTIMRTDTGEKVEQARMQTH